MDEKAINILLKGYLPISLLPPSKLQEILGKVKKAIQTTNLDYDIVVKRLHLYYNIKFLTFGIDREKFNNSISSFCTAIYTATADTVSIRTSSSSHCRSK